LESPQRHNSIPLYPDASDPQLDPDASIRQPDPGGVQPTLPSIGEHYGPDAGFIPPDIPAYTNAPTGLQPALAQPGGPPPYTGYTNVSAGSQPPASRRRRLWVYPIGVLVLALVLLSSFALGKSLAGNPSSTASNGGTTTSTVSTVVVPPSAQDLQQTLINVSRAVQPSVVEVTSLSQSGEAIGSGVILSKDGYIATNDHVVSGYSQLSVTLSNGSKYSAQVVGTDPQDDLAVLKIAATNLQPITFADSSEVQVGQFALAIGNPLGLEDSTTFGIVSAVNRAESEQPGGPAAVLAGMIQTSAPINPGNSGGALVNLQGQLIGMPTLGAANSQNGGTASGIGFAISSNRIKFVTDQLIQNGKLTSTGQGFLGIEGQDITPQLAASQGLSVQQGVLVQGFASDTSGKSPAQQAGLQAGDVIVAVNGQAVTDNVDLAGRLLVESPGTTVTLTVQRGSSQQTIQVTLGERPVSQG
jgi:S1-C subfamily serine protease